MRASLLSYQVDLNNPVVWIVSFFSLVSNPTGFFSNSLETVQSTPDIIGITVTLSFQISFLALWINPFICLSFHFLLFSLRGPLKRQNAGDG